MVVIERIETREPNNRVDIVRPIRTTAELATQAQIPKVRAESQSQGTSAANTCDIA